MGRLISVTSNPGHVAHRERLVLTSLQAATTITIHFMIG